MAEVLIRKAALFRTEEECHFAPCEALSNEPRAVPQIAHHMLGVALAQCCCTHNQRAIRNSLGYGFVFVCLCEQRGCAYCRPRFAECHFERVHENHAQAVEFVFSQQGLLIYTNRAKRLRRHRLAARNGALPRGASAGLHGKRAVT